jgi:hypothetical protein
VTVEGVEVGIELIELMAWRSRRITVVSAGYGRHAQADADGESREAPADQLLHEPTTGIQTNAGGGHQSAYPLSSGLSAH